MKIKILFSILVFVAFLASCTGDKKKTETKSSETTSVKTPEELKQLNSQLLANPDNADLYNQRANYYFNAKDFAASMADISKAIKLDSSKADYYFTLSNVYFVINQTGKSKAALEKCIKLDDKNTDAMMKLAELYLYVKKYEKSMEYINMALRINKNNAKGYFMKGMNYKELHDTARAISSMQTAVEQDQQYYNAYIQLGLLCAAKHNSLAAQYYKDALKIQPRSTEALYDLGKYFQDEGDWNNALDTYNSLLKIDATYKYAHYNMGVIYFMGIKDNAKAIDQYSQAINIDAKYVEAYYARGVCYKAMNNLIKAVNDFNSCNAINPDFIPATLALKEMK